MFFADPHTPWHQPTNENTNDLLRQYFPGAPTRRAGPRRTLMPSPMRTTIGHAISSDGRHPVRSSRSNCVLFNTPVLHRPFELAQ